MLYRYIEPFVRNWNKFNKEQKEIVVKGFKCLLSSQKRIVERRVIKYKNGGSTFTTWEDEEGNRFGTIWSVRFVGAEEKEK